MKINDEGLKLKSCEQICETQEHHGKFQKIMLMNIL